MNNHHGQRGLGILSLLLWLVLYSQSVSGGSLYAFGNFINGGPRPLYKINPTNGLITQTITSAFVSGTGDLVGSGLAYGGGYLYGIGKSVNSGPRPLYKVNPTTGSIAQTVTSAFRPFGDDLGDLGLAYSGGYLYAFGFSVNSGPRPFYKINPTNGSIAQTITSSFQPLGNDIGNIGLAYGGGYLWAFGNSVNLAPRPLYKINPANGSIAQIITSVFVKGRGDVGNFGLAYGRRLFVCVWLWGPQ